MKLKARIHRCWWAPLKPWRVQLWTSDRRAGPFAILYFPTWEQAMHYADRVVNW